MGDRNNPIKFGPEWLRNLSRERNLRSSSANTQNTASSTSTTLGNVGSPGAVTTNSTISSVTSSTNSKVQLAKLRYGREEMLALYDRTSEAPQELKYIELLYQPRGKPPVALNNTFEDDMRENMRPGPPAGNMLSGERFGIGRGLGRGGSSTSETRGRPRIPFVRQTSTGRSTSWHLGNPRMPGYSGGADEEPAPTLRSWNNNGNVSTARNTGDTNEWAQNKMFRSKRPGSSTNWRQPNRDDDEWRLSDNARSRQSQQEKWERDWGDRQQDKPPSWNSNRRTWVGGDSQNSEDNLPEWAVDGTEACAGTFDSSGAFHGGYSHDDSNLPKSPQDSSFPLARSHTHGSFIRSKTVEEGSEEWWASEKAKKLSPKRFDASEIKFKKPIAQTPDTNATSNKLYNNGEPDVAPSQEKPESPVNTSTGPPAESIENNSNIDDGNKRHVRFSESKTFDSLVRPDINPDEASDERGNFQSVMITPNNSLRQKHQKIVSSSSSHETINQNKNVQLLQNTSTNQLDSMIAKQSQTPEEQIVNEIVDMTLEDKEGLPDLKIPSDKTLINSSSTSMHSGISTMVNAMSQMPNPLQLRMSSPVLPNQGLSLNIKPNLTAPGMHGAGMQTGLQSAGITNSALNVSLGLPHGNNPINQPLGIPMPGVPPPVLPNQGLSNHSMNASAITANAPGIQNYQSSSGMPGMPASNIGNSSLFLGQNSNNSNLQSSNEMQLSNHHGSQTNIFPLHSLQHSPTAGAFGSSLYNNIIQQNSAPPSANNQNLVDQWYYEDPKKNIQGPFSSKEMYNWYRAGFFSPSLMVRRACDTIMRPLGSYGPVVPFAQMDVMYPLSSGYESRNQGPHESLINTQQGLGLDVMNMPNLSESSSMQFGTVGLMRNPPYGQQQMVDSFWSQPSPPELIWMQQAMNTQRDEARVNNLPMFFWDQQPSAVTTNPILPEEIAKEMKTEEQILAQLRASHTISTPQNIIFLNETPQAAPLPPAEKVDISFSSNVNTAPDLEELQKLISEDTLKDNSSSSNTNIQNQEPPQQSQPPLSKEETVQAESNVPKPLISDTKTVKQSKNEAEKVAKIKESVSSKIKCKKPKEEKKDDVTEVKIKEEILQKKECESSPSKTKKDEKLSKKDLEKERKEWIKDGYTIVKGAEKNTASNKKKSEELKPSEDTDKKRKEDKLAAEEEKKKKQAELAKKQQEQQQQQQQRQSQESVNKKAPWSAVTNQASQSTIKDGLTLAEIQRLEREKKLEQMKEQQQMMQIIAQQQAANLAREQEMQSGLGWAKKKTTTVCGQSLTDIQDETRKQSAATMEAFAGVTQPVEDVPPPFPSQPNHMPWGNPPNGGFWDTQNKAQQASKKADQNKSKKKTTANPPLKKETTPAIEFESWCTTVLASWSAKVDVPTFVGFLKDIESPYEVKDYVKCYLGESKDSSDFARQFLERRSKLLRVGMVTPSDDLCSPAMAINPRSTSSSDYQEVKGKGKKTKKNKMLKVDARILGFSVTAAEDRINVGDIDTV